MFEHTREINGKTANLYKNGVKLVKCNAAISVDIVGYDIIKKSKIKKMTICLFCVLMFQQT